ncbi:MAG: quinone-dependent dihydroorotate dehydrogenase [Pseudomonadales bacterium]|nr:quinone-dependent dihydroorotate dehydrogenase [Pseudomonadales bacterium]
MNYRTLRNMLFCFPTETSHHLSLQAISLAHQLKLTPLIAREVPSAPVNVMGLDFPNPVGLAAGLDKDAKAIDGLGSLGFGFLEVGTVTPRPQPGNPRPRLFRIPSRRAIINRMGFNNEGVDAMCKRIRRAGYTGILGINIGKNAVTPVENALDDYELCLRKVYKLASYIVVNISSPNTPGLRNLQHEAELAALLEGLKKCHATLVDKHEKYVPLVVKIAPDMEDSEARQVAAQLMQFEIDGVIVSNTTVSRDNIAGEVHSSETGGLSGEPVRDQSNHILSLVADEVKGKMAIIGVGGIMSGADAAEKIRLGADLVQLYTGFIYEGPDLIFDSVQAITASQRAPGSE